MDILHEFQTLQGIYNSKIQNCRFLDNICACAKLTNEVHGAPQLEKTKKSERISVSDIWITSHCVERQYAKDFNDMKLSW